MHLESIPPWAYKYLSKLNTEQIASSAKLSRSTVIRISRLPSFDSVRFGIVKRYISGCGFNPSSPPVRLWVDMCENGIGSVKHRQDKKSDRPWVRGARANNLKFIRRVVGK